MIKHVLFCLFIISLALQLQAQDKTQIIRGTVLDTDSHNPLIGASVAISQGENLWGNYTDDNGQFRIENVTIGRVNISIAYLGYESQNLKSMLVTTGKEVVLTIELAETAHQLQEIVVTSSHDKAEAINEMAVVSARSFSVEETARYASSFYDPARMAQNYAGVTTGQGEDIYNEIIVRGNSPKGISWRLEGIEIPNPNHFGTLGSSGGGISMLSSSTLTNSDFYTGAFPAEYGNAFSGVFDIKLRKGNNEKRESSFMLGALGIELSTEGPFKREGNSSYLINYRYSTLGALEAIGLNPVQDVLPKYQDVSFKFHFPTEKAGNFSLFGLGGHNSSTFNPVPDSLAWESSDDKWGWDESQTVGVLGLSHQIILSDKSYLRTVGALSKEKSISDYYFMDRENEYETVTDELTEVQNNSLRLSTTLNSKINNKHTIRAGVVLSHIGFDFNFKERYKDIPLTEYYDNNGSTQMLQSFFQWKWRLSNKWAAFSGLHYSHLLLNQTGTIEPRLALQWKMAEKHTLSFSAGLHSKMEHIAIYFFDGELPGENPTIPNKELEMTKAFHGVVGYDFRLSKDLRLKIETYFQHLFDIPVESDPTSPYSLINSFDIWDVIGADRPVNEGTGRNIGVDVTLEKFFSNNYYFLITGTLFDSKYTAQDGKEYNTRFNSNYQLNTLIGKEFKVGRDLKNILALNGKVVFSGGNRFTPVDFEASELKGEHVEFKDRQFESRTDPYFRIDWGISYKINRQKSTHSIMLDIQNTTNHSNVYTQYYDDDSNSIEKYYQTGFFPVFNYRIEF